jgi:UDP:flavonoid glycosyltransferase YjiC (YdhE family)
MVAPSTAHTGVTGMVDTVLAALDGAGVRVAISMLDAPPTDLPSWASAGLGRQDELLTHAAAVVGGGGHGLLAKSLLAGVPIVTIPGGGDQWELANRAARQGSSILVRPLPAEAVRAAVLDLLADPDYTAAALTAAAGAASVSDPIRLCHAVLSSVQAQ